MKKNIQLFLACVTIGHKMSVFQPKSHRSEDKRKTQFHPSKWSWGKTQWAATDRWMSTQTQRDSAGQCNGLQPNHCHRRHHWKENNWKENWAKRGILFAEEFASQHLVTVQPEQKPELLQCWVRRGTEPLLGKFSWRAGPHGTCTTFQLHWTGTCQQPQKHFHHSFSSQWSLKESGGADFVSNYREHLQEWEAKKEKMWSLDLKM